MIQTNRAGVYIMGDRVVWRPDRSRTENINLFGGFVRSLELQEIMRQQVYGGAVWTAPFRSRPRDTIGFSASYFLLTPREVEYLRDARIKAGGSGTNDPHEFTFELNYAYEIAPNIRLTPNVQYIVNPDNSAIPKTSVLPKNILAFGLSLNVNFGAMLGFTRPPSTR